jgi:hypothetical protein
VLVGPLTVIGWEERNRWISLDDVVSFLSTRQMTDDMSLWDNPWLQSISREVRTIPHDNKKHRQRKPKLGETRSVKYMKNRSHPKQRNHYNKM